MSASLQEFDMINFDSKKLAYFGTEFEMNAMFRPVNYRSWKKSKQKKLQILPK